MTLTIRHLGKKGRFANQLFQYAHLRQRAGDDYQCPSWVGQRLFGLEDPTVTSEATDIGTKFPYDSSWYDKDLFRSLFQPTAEWANRKKEDSPVVGVHVRRGDYGTFTKKSARWCFRTPVSWYSIWLKENDYRIPTDYTVFVASDDPDIALEEFQSDRVWRGSSGEFWWDFYTLTQCDYLLISNSTFSYAASMLNETAKEFWRPRLSEEKLIPYDPWDSKIVLKDELYAV